MSIRVYSGLHSSGRPAATKGMWIPWTFAGLTVLGQILWVLTSGNLRTTLTITTVVTFALSSASHAFITRGTIWTSGYLIISLGVGLAVEAVGTATSIPFGPYSYSDLLGAKVFGVPWVIPLAWAMMAYPCLLLARRLSSSRIWVPIIGAWTLASWDLFLDPQMVGQGYWTWTTSIPSLPGIPGIPFTNYLGWLIVAVIMMALLDLLPRARASVKVPALLLMWTYASSVLANAVFFGRPWVALWGGIAMGITVLPWAYRLWFGRP